MTYPLGGLLVLTVAFSILGAVAAFLITYQEWSHHYPEGREAFRMGMEAAIVAFLALGVLATAVNILIIRFM